MEENLCPLKEEYVEWVGHDNGTMFGKYNPSLRVGELGSLGEWVLLAWPSDGRFSDSSKDLEKHRQTLIDPTDRESWWS